MKRFTKTLAVLTVTGIVSAAMFAYAGDTKDGEQIGRHHGNHFVENGVDSNGPHLKHHHRGRGHMPFAEELNLTDAQKQVLEASRAARKPAAKATSKKLRAAHEALNNAGEQNADDATLNRLANELASFIAEQEVSRIKAQREFFSVLTPEQQEKLVALKAERKDPARWKGKEDGSTSK